MVADHPNRGNEEAQQLVTPTNVIWNIPHQMNFQNLLLRLVRNLFDALVQDDQFATIDGATGGDNQWFLYGTFQLQLLSIYLL